MQSHWPIVTFILVFYFKTLCLGCCWPSYSSLADKPFLASYIITDNLVISHWFFFFFPQMLIRIRHRNSWFCAVQQALLDTANWILFLEVSEQLLSILFSYFSNDVLKSVSWQEVLLLFLYCSRPHHFFRRLLLGGEDVPVLHWQFDF